MQYEGLDWRFDIQISSKAKPVEYKPKIFLKLILKG